MGMNWCEDRIHDMVMDLDKLNRVWDRQCFEEPTMENTQHIKKGLERVKVQIENTIIDLRMWGP